MLILVVGLVPTALRAQAASSPKESTESRVDYDSVRRELGNFETAIDDVIRDTFSNPFGLVNKPKGVYLPGYGQVFTFLVNIQRAVIKTPFGDYRSGQVVTAAEKKKRIADLEDRLVRVLLDHASALDQVRPTESVAIVALFEDHSFPEEDNQNKTIVLSTIKKDLDEWAQQPDRWREFKQRIKIIEY
jgi:hypothetical protein